MWRNGNNIFILQSFTLRTVFMGKITFINEGISVSLFSVGKKKKNFIIQEQVFWVSQFCKAGGFSIIWR
jgi:hypothetical protein